MKIIMLQDKRINKTQCKKNKFYTVDDATARYLIDKQIAKKTSIVNLAKEHIEIK